MCKSKICIIIVLKKGMSQIECSIESVFGNMKYISKLLNHKNDFNVTVGILKFWF